MVDVIIDNHQIIDPPPPQPLRYGLFSAATMTEDLGPREIAAGFQFAGVDCGVSRLYDSKCLASANPGKTFDQGLVYQTADPFWVYSTRQCGSVGTTPQFFSESVRRRLLGGEQTQVEAAIWGGTAPAVDPNLTGHAGTVTVIPAVLGAGSAIAALEESFYSAYGYIGTIHVNTVAYAPAAYANLIVQGSVLKTPLGSLWSFGAGYGITGPAGVAPSAGHVWAFMTPQTWIRRSQIIAQDDPGVFLNRSTNQFLGLAERVYAAVWTCDVVHAVQIPISAPFVISLAA